MQILNADFTQIRKAGLGRFDALFNGRVKGWQYKCTEVMIEIERLSQ